jgi:hypothetical protein
VLRETRIEAIFQSERARLPRPRQLSGRVGVRRVGRGVPPVAVRDAAAVARALAARALAALPDVVPLARA